MSQKRASVSSGPDGNFPRDRIVCDADWRFGTMRRRAKGRSTPAALRRLQMFCLYEYARESSALVAWAENRGTNGWPKASEFGRQLERESPKLYHLAMHLAAELAADKPWQTIPEAKISRVLCEDEEDESHVRLPSYDAPWPWALRPAYDHQCKSAITWERWAQSKDRSRPEVEVLALQIDWKHATNSDLANALAYWRPAHIPEPTASRGAGRGKRKATDFGAWLLDLGVLRLFRYFPEKQARELAEREFRISRADLLARSRRRARQVFEEAFRWLENPKSFIAPS